MTTSTADRLSFGVGVDLVRVDRVRGCLDSEQFLRSTFTSVERHRAAAAADVAHAYAATFAAKEAVFKALHLAPEQVVVWADVEIHGAGPHGLTATLHGHPIDVDITHLPAPAGHVLCVAHARKDPGR